MRKTIFTALMLATLLPATGAMAQNGELRGDRQDVRQDQRDLRHAQMYGDRRDVRDARQDLRDSRREYREDWRDYRNDHRDIYRRGTWRAPFAYQRFREGVILRPTYYSSRYYISDFGRYRLPPPVVGARYVRHYDDVLLVDVRSGRVIRVYNSFFF